MSFEIVIIVRDRNGDPVLDPYGNPKKKLYSEETAYKLWETWNKNSVNVKKSKKRKETKAATKPEEINRALKSIDTYVEKIKKKRKKFDDEE